MSSGAILILLILDFIWTCMAFGTDTFQGALLGCLLSVVGIILLVAYDNKKQKEENEEY